MEESEFEIFCLEISTEFSEDEYPSDATREVISPYVPLNDLSFYYLIQRSYIRTVDVGRVLQIRVLVKGKAVKLQRRVERRCPVRKGPSSGFEDVVGRRGFRYSGVEVPAEMTLVQDRWADTCRG